MTNTGFYNTNLPPHLRVLKDEIEGIARGYGLDFFETIFEVIDADDLNEIAAYGGFPTRYPHWSFGMQYEQLSKSYSYGLSKIYEMVINNDPCYAYLMRCNHTVDQKLVMAHVYGHCDFFKNNAYFAHTNRKMMDEIANHASRIRRYVERFGEDEVEQFMDRCLSIDDLIDIHSVAIRRRDVKNKYDFDSPDGAEEDDDTSPKFKAKDYMADFINPVRKDAPGATIDTTPMSFPDKPEKDVLLFLIEHAPLKPWQRDILSIIRDEAYYFYPQAQTKIMNEGWACVAGDTLIPTDRGFVRAVELVENRLPAKVSDGEKQQRLVEWVRFENRATITIRTRRGFTLTGSTNHRVMQPDGSWSPLDQLKKGDPLKLAVGSNVWPKKNMRIAWSPHERMSIEDVCENANVSLRTLYRHVNGAKIRQADSLTKWLAKYESERNAIGQTIAKTRKSIRIPGEIDEDFASFLGSLIGDGHISLRKRTIGLTTGDEILAREFAALTERLFGITPRVVAEQNGRKYRVKFSSQNLADFLISLGLTTGFSARRKTVPDCILRSPKSVMAAFLRSLFDCDGYAGKQGVILSTSSTVMSEMVQQVLLNFGILSTRALQSDGCWHVRITGSSAQVYSQFISFCLPRKQKALRDYLDSHQWFKTETAEDEIVSIETGRGDVYDFTVDETHRYAAGGLINHNSYWHSTIMTQKVLAPSEFIDYADHHSGTMATSGGRLNPYKLGIELLRDVEERWNKGQFGPEWDACENEQVRRTWDKQTGLGRQKIFEIRKVHNDITFLDTYLTPEFCVRHKLFSFNFQQPTQNYVIESREFQQVKQRLLSGLTNFGKPWIYVINGNHRNRGELLLRHEYDGVELKLSEARDTLVNVQKIWGRPVFLETVKDDHPVLLGFDGTDHTIHEIGAENDSRRNPARRP